VHLTIAKYLKRHYSAQKEVIASFILTERITDFICSLLAPTYNPFFFVDVFFPSAMAAIDGSISSFQNHQSRRLVALEFQVPVPGWLKQNRTS
jgi:hypothetical protein